ncbi:MULTISPECIES: CaiB/BaiF CoA-transferase family protein [unclassified Rhodococcus (in: high G+C Gram-positive bacteria)]|uniref:CaiB/BaiF CoA transferase family protein n=1 Tax=unclassified Rhodococcus (in: high G+C Gram-positive bacteria) TaxID=192944 RepID=UPI00163AEE93|nr:MULTISPECIES: CoA transferase [unclassified Rhodococcus (in: high G+C Gram-positive bacteria)]MBC2642017.1 CoA transferase [Rhodococcus sp. 3A]MBC2893241.1 CoA transferase [Rhodococcus sp. 4CII]
MTVYPHDAAPTAPSAGNPDGAASPSPGPLHGVRVLDISTVYAAPITAMLLGDFGAEVIKVEHPTGDPARSHGADKNGHGLWWKVISRNKRCITLDLGTPEGQQLLRDLLVDADVLVENFRPGVLEKWGLGPDRLSDINPGLITLRVTGFGQDGPYAHRRAFGTLAEAMSGFAHQTGEEARPPTLPPFGLADGVAGITGAFGVVTALLHRNSPEGDGHGQVIDLSLLEPLVGILGPGPTAFDQLGTIAGRHGNRSPNNAPRNTFLTKDDRWVAISASATSVAERVMRLVGRADLVDEPWFASAGERSRNGDLLDEAVGKWIAARPLDEVVAEFDRVGAALAPIYDVEQLMNDPHVIARDTITTVEDEDLGPLKMQNLMLRMLGTPGAIRFPGRRLGQDNTQIYGDTLGLDAPSIEVLRERGVI